MGLSAMDRKRVELAKIISAARVRRPEVFASGEITNAEGAKVVIPVLFEDSVVWVMHRVIQAGGTAQIIALGSDPSDEKPQIRTAEMSVSSHGLHGEDSGHLPVSDRTTIGSFFQMFVPGASVTLAYDGDSDLRFRELDGPTSTTDLVSA